MRAACSTVIVALALGAPAPAGAKDDPDRAACLAKLDELGVPYETTGAKKGIEIPVKVTGPLGGVTYETWKAKDLILDCSLVYSLALAGRYFTDAGMTSARYSSSYDRRNIRGTNHPSQHSFGLAIDVHGWSGDGVPELSVDAHYEQGLGDDVDCIGAPLTDEGRTLRTFACRLERSGLFRFILTPDYDAAHYNHFHIEALPWGKRTDVEQDPSP